MKSEKEEEIVNLVRYVWHGTQRYGTVVWSFGEEAYEIIKELLFLREKLKPYIMAQMKKAHETGIPVMKPLFFDFPQDPQTYDIGDEYMFGPDILVTPVAEKGKRSRKVYLPNGAKWQEFDGSKEYDGGKWIEFEALLNKILAFRKNSRKIF
jgi:alpha-D-xyloside xylohydrolase